MTFKNKIILITGSSGSWGTELITQLLKTKVKEIRGLARGEFNQVKSTRKFKDPRFKIIIGDIRDYGKLKFACRKVDYVFHLSALKHVPICEDFPYEAIKTNINGTRNLVRAAIDNKVKIVVDVSTDKAVLPINTYGMTKAIGEKLTLNASRLSDNTKFMVVRGGNVLGTAGSVVPFWIDQIKRFNKITITDKKMTRYFLTLSEAIKLLFVAIESKKNGGLFVMKMPSCKIIDLAEVLKDHYGNKDTKIEIMGIRPGEKLNEVLISKHETPNAYKYGKNYYLINLDINKPIKKLKKVTFKEYNSTQNAMNKKQIKELLKKGGFLV
ncbi:hypothetical protein LCGC14_1001720 [marine sediment metagenome]|uniref:Polysaccharide biosynthesis protein CapD-like domain-containing protein n=1 Tax=marine sediment metagenome TaxID=412755 RepID=A0A0F9R903_9ZZZZ